MDVLVVVLKVLTLLGELILLLILLLILEASNRGRGSDLFVLLQVNLSLVPVSKIALETVGQARGLLLDNLLRPVLSLSLRVHLLGLSS